jgi:hypothetical protein
MSIDVLTDVFETVRLRGGILKFDGDLLWAPCCGMSGCSLKRLAQWHNFTFS